MTLVVARIHKDRIAIAADTRISHHQVSLPLNQGLIKTCIIDCSVCVAFSNSPELARRDILAFAGKFRTSKPFGETIEFFEHSSQNTGNDYIVTFANPPRIIKIVDGRRVASVSKTYWIGDRSAYVAFRKCETDRRARTEHGRAFNAVFFADEMEGSPASDLYAGLRNVVSDPAVSSVGGFVSVVSNRPEGFRYSVYSDMLYDWPLGKTDEYIISLKDKLQLGASGENVGFSVAQLSPGFIGANPVAFYFVSARCLFVFSGPNNGPAHHFHTIRDIPPDMVERALFDLFGFDWKWLAMVTCAPPSLGGPRRSELEPSSRGLGLSFVCRLNTMPKRQED